MRASYKFRDAANYAQCKAVSGYVVMLADFIRSELVKTPNNMPVSGIYIAFNPARIEF
jgi:hypothetical protein